MKRFLILLLALMLCFSFVSCGGNPSDEPDDPDTSDEEMDVEEDEPEEILSDGEYDFGLKALDEFGLLPIFEKREYKGLLELENEFRVILRSAVEDADLGEFDYHEDISLLEEYEEMKEQMSEEEFAMFYSDEVFVTCDEVGDEIEKSAFIQTGIVQDFESGNNLFFHYAEFESEMYYDASEADAEKLCASIEKVFGTELDPAKVKEGFEKVLSVAKEQKKTIILNQSITSEKDGYSENIAFSTESIKEYKGYAVRAILTRTRTYEDQGQ